jgi:hypothetical protein
MHFQTDHKVSLKQAMLSLCVTIILEWNIKW